MPDCQLCAGQHRDDETACPELRTGQTIDKYVVGPLLGVGGIAAVYVAEHPILKRQVAIKVLHKRWAKDAELTQRFVRRTTLFHLSSGRSERRRVRDVHGRRIFKRHQH